MPAKKKLRMVEKYGPMVERYSSAKQKMKHEKKEGKKGEKAEKALAAKFKKLPKGGKTLRGTRTVAQRG